jgi:ribosomal protein S4
LSWDSDLGLLERRLDAIPSMRIKAGDALELTPKAKLARVPALSDVPYPVQMEPHFVVEYYSR